MILPLLVVQLTNRCNFACRICGQSRARSGGEVQFMDLSRTALENYFKGSPGFFKEIYCWGGEPFIHPEVASILGILRNYCETLSINTNGSNHQTIIKLFKAGLIDELVLSLDGPEPVNDRLRNTGSYQTVMKILHEITPVYPDRIRINITLSPDNIDSLLSLAAMLADMGITYISLQMPMYVNETLGRKYDGQLMDRYQVKSKFWQGFVQPDLRIDGDQILSILDAVEDNVNVKYRYFPIRSREAGFYRRYFCNDAAELKREIVSCDFTESYAIDPFGNFILCPDFPDIILGNIQTTADIASVQAAKREVLAQIFATEPLGVCYRCCHNQSACTFFGK